MLDVVIIGAGPAGSGLLSCLYRDLNVENNSALKICMIDARGPKDFGTLADYDIPSDTRASKFLTCLDGLPPSVMSSVGLIDLTKLLSGYKEEAVPLPQAGSFFRVLGKLICQDMISKGQLILEPNTKVESAIWCDTYWQLKTKTKVITAKSLVLACGATEVQTRFFDFLNAYSMKIEDLKSWCLSSDILKFLPDATLLNKLRAKPNPKVSIIGGSHSAISTAAKLLNQKILFKEGGVKIFHRKPMHVTFDSAEAARHCGFDDFGVDDICPATKRVFALKGFRLDSRDLLMAIKGYGDVPRETRVELADLKTVKAANLKAELQSSHLVISALGYEPNYIPLYSKSLDQKIELNGPNFVDEKSRLLTSSQAVIPQCYALGLASNYNLAERFGERSFTGQANGLVLWHKDIGMEIASQLTGN